MNKDENVRYQNIHNSTNHDKEGNLQHQNLTLEKRKGLKSKTYILHSGKKVLTKNKHKAY